MKGGGGAMKGGSAKGVPCKRAVHASYWNAFLL